MVIIMIKGHLSNGNAKGGRCHFFLRLLRDRPGGGNDGNEEGSAKGQQFRSKIMFRGILNLHIKDFNEKRQKCM